MFRLDNLSKHVYSFVYPILKVLGMTTSTAAKYPNYLLRSDSGALNEASIHVFRDTLAGYYAKGSRETSRALRVSKIVLYKNMAAPRPPQHEYLVAWVEAEGCRPSLVKIERLRSPQNRQDEQPDKQPDKQPDEPTPKRSMLASDWSSASRSLDSIKPNNYANDKITGLDHPPSDDVQVLTLEFGDNNVPLYYYQLVVLARAVCDHNEYYNVFKENCYWYAGVVCGILRQQFPNVKVTESEEYDPHSCYGPLGITLWHTAIDIGQIDFWKEVKKFEEQEIGSVNRQMQGIVKGIVKAKDEEMQGIVKAKDEEIQGFIKAKDEEIKAKDEEMQGIVKAKDEEIKAKDEEMQGIVKGIVKAKDEEIQGIVQNNKAQMAQKDAEIEELRKKLDSLKPKDSEASEAQNTSSDSSQNPADVPQNHAGTGADAVKATAKKSTAGGGRVRMKKTSMIKVQA